MRIEGAAARGRPHGRAGAGGRRRRQGDGGLVRKAAPIYRGWSQQPAHADIRAAGRPQTGEAPLLLISGFGANRVLERECGLHVLELADGHSGANRATARVRLAITPLGDVPAAKLPGALPRRSGNAAAKRGRAPLPRRARPAGAQRRRQLAQRPSMPCCGAISTCSPPTSRRRSGVDSVQAKPGETRPRVFFRPLRNRFSAPGHAR